VLSMDNNWLNLHQFALYSTINHIYLLEICRVYYKDELLFGISYCMINLLCKLQHTASSIQQQLWTEQNVLKRDMEVVVCDVEQCTVEMLWISSIWH